MAFPRPSAPVVGEAALGAAAAQHTLLGAKRLLQPSPLIPHPSALSPHPHPHPSPLTLTLTQPGAKRLLGRKYASPADAAWLDSSEAAGLHTCALVRGEEAEAGVP